MNRSAKVFALGTGGAILSRRRDNTALLILLGQHPLIIDFPGSPNKKIETAGINSLEVRTALISHHHVDHLYGLPSLLHNQHLRLSQDIGIPSDVDPALYELNLFLSEDAIAVVKDLLKVFGFDRRPGMFPVIMNSLIESKGSVDLWDGWIMDYLEARHGSMRSLSFILRNTTSAIVIAYSGDSEPVDCFLRRAEGADVLIHDCQCLTNASKGHTDADALIDGLRRHGKPKKIVPVHLDITADSQIEQIAQKIEDALGIRCHIPEDGEIVFETTYAMTA